MTKTIPGFPAQDVVTSVLYGSAGQLQGMSYGGYTESRQYNSMLQLTRLTATAAAPAKSLDLQYTYPSANAGRISQVTDLLSGEQVTYAYDALNRLIQAVSNDPAQGQSWAAWGLSFTYDGFGNRLRQDVVKGTAIPSILEYSAATNRISTTGFQYDANGNLTAAPGGASYTYDGENRLTQTGGETYIYNHANQRICRGICSEVYSYGVSGETLGRYQPNFGLGISSYITLSTNLYFAGKLINSQGTWVVTDRLGSVRANSAGESFRYQPYGEEQGSSAQGRHKFGTYFRDNSGLDYANQRYYSSAAGRFLTPDVGTGDPSEPASWSRYSYTGGDPTNRNDPAGLSWQYVSWTTEIGRAHV
jgi:RHS repeat-associated protein